MDSYRLLQDVERERKRIGSDVSSEDLVFDSAGERREGLLSDQVVRRGWVCFLFFVFKGREEIQDGRSVRCMWW